MKGLLACIGGLCLLFLLGSLITVFFNVFGEVVGGIILWIIIGLVYAFRKPIWEKLSPYWYKLIYWGGMVFSNRVAFRYGKLINAICNMDSYYEILKEEQNIVVIQILDSSKFPFMKWEIQRDMKNKEAWDHKQVKITCQYLTGNFKIPITSLFSYNEDQLLMFNVALQKLNAIKIDSIKE